LVAYFGQLQKADSGKRVGYVGQLPNQVDALLNKIIHATTSKSEGTEFRAF